MHEGGGATQEHALPILMAGFSHTGSFPEWQGAGNLPDACVLYFLNMDMMIISFIVCMPYQTVLPRGMFEVRFYRRPHLLRLS